MKFVKSILAELYTSMFPPDCPLCKKESEEYKRKNLICDSCLNDFQEIKEPICICCGIPFKSSKASNHLCFRCKKNKPFFHKLTSLWKYEGSIKKGIFEIKFNGNQAAAKALLNHKKAYLQEFSKGYDFFIPVPIHKSDFFKKGFNHASIIAEELSDITGITVLNNRLVKSKITVPQVELKMAERKKNLRNCFEIKREPFWYGTVINKIKKVKICNESEKSLMDFFIGKKILIIDDVVTTGSTISEIARVLKKYGVDEVDGLSIARTI